VAGLLTEPPWLGQETGHSHPGLLRGYLSVTVAATESATLRISYHALVWKTDSPGRSAIASQIRIRDSQFGIEASAGFSGQRGQPAKASSPEDYLNIYTMIRINGNPNTYVNNNSWVYVGQSVTPGWTWDSDSLSRTWFTNVPAGTHTVTLVLGSWDGGVSHSRPYGLNVEVLKQHS